MFKKLAALCAAASVATLAGGIQPLAAGASGPGPLYGITRSQDLVTIDPATGAFTTLSNLFLAGAQDSQTSELAANPAAGKLYGDRFSFVNTSSGSVFKEELLTIDATTGAVVNSVPGHFGALVVDQSAGLLYGFDGSSRIFRVNPGTGATTPVATIGSSCVCIWSLDVDPNTHTIYASAEDISGSVEDETTRIFSVNVASGVVTTSPMLTQVVRQIVVDPASGQLFGVTDSFTHDFVRIDPGTGTTDFVASIVPSADPNVSVQFGMAADGTNHTVFGAIDTNDISTNDVIDQLVSIQDQTGVVSIDPVVHTDFIVSAGLAFAGPAPTITPETIKGDVQSALASGAITKAGVAKTLLAELNDAEAARDRGQCKTAGNIYQQFISDVTAQTGKSIANATAAQLISEAQFLIANCP
jgi:hypothetical protein